MVQLLAEVLQQLSPSEPNPFSVSLLDELVARFGWWEPA